MSASRSLVYHHVSLEQLDAVASALRSSGYDVPPRDPGTKVLSGSFSAGFGYNVDYAYSGETFDLTIKVSGPYIFMDKAVAKLDGAIHPFLDPTLT